MMKHHFTMLARYNRWANQRLWSAADALTDDEYRRNAGAFFGSMHGTLSHVLVADRIWLHRFTGRGETYTQLDVVPYDDRIDLRSARVLEDERIAAFVDALDEDALSGTFTYTPVTTPDPVTQRLAPALTHVFNHHTHHRGQAHTILTSLGHRAPALDLIYFSRDARARA